MAEQLCDGLQVLAQLEISHPCAAPSGAALLWMGRLISCATVLLYDHSHGYSCRTCLWSGSLKAWPTSTLFTSRSHAQLYMFRSGIDLRAGLQG